MTTFSSPLSLLEADLRDRLLGFIFIYFSLRVAMSLMPRPCRFRRVDWSKKLEGDELEAISKRRRFTRVVDWSKLESDVLEAISKRLGIEDYIRAEAVCKSWQLVLKVKQRPFLQDPHNQPPWLAIPDKSSPICKFYNLKENKFHHIYLPELRESLCIGSSHGWMIVVDELLNIFLLNPLTRSRTQLPPITSFSCVTTFHPCEDGITKTYYAYLDDDDDDDDDDDKYEPRLFPAECLQAHFFSKVILSGNPSLTRDYIVMAICGDLRHLVFCRPGDKQWTFVDYDYDNVFVLDLIYWKHNFYALVNSNELFVVNDLERGGKVAEVGTPGFYVGFTTKFYLVVSAGGKLLLVGRTRSDEYVHRFQNKTVEFKVYMLDQETVNWVPFTNLKGDVMFLGRNFGFSFNAKEFPQCKANHIYFTDDMYSSHCAHIPQGRPPVCAQMTVGHDLGCFSLRSGRVRRLPCFPPPSRIPIWAIWPSPFWVTLFHGSLSES